MKKFKFLYVFATMAVPLFVVATPVFAAGQIAGGNIYKVRNLTQNTGFTDPGNASCNDTIQFRVHIHNIGPDPLVNVRARATLPSGEVNHFVSTMTVSADNSRPASTSDTATVNLSSNATVAYIAGSTDWTDFNGNVLGPLSDGITQGGIVLPQNVGVSHLNSRLVRFKVKVNCPSAPAPTPTPTPTPTKGLPSTGPASVIGMFAGASILGAAGHYLVSRRRHSA